MKKSPLFYCMAILGACATSYTQSAYAFKVDTHAWVAQQVLNDIQDGNVSFRVQGMNIEIPVPPSALNALQSNPGAYRAGSMGPDAFPDIIAGQMVVHPGGFDKNGNPIQSAWKTDQWLKHLLSSAQQKQSPSSLAFAYGYASHLASDVWAHTYVNKYAGDIFLLSDNETVVERRHILLEALISKHTPPLRNQNGSLLGNYYDSGLYSINHAELRDILLYAKPVQEQYTIQYSGAGHLAGISKLREKVVELEGKLSNNSVSAPRVYLTTQAQEAAEKLGMPVVLLDLHKKIDAELNRKTEANVEQIQKLNNEFLGAAKKVVAINASLADKSINFSKDISLQHLRLAQKAAELRATIAEDVENRIISAACKTVKDPITRKHYVINPVACRQAKDSAAVRQWLEKKAGLEAQITQLQNAISALHNNLSVTNQETLRLSTNAIESQRKSLELILANYEKAIPYNVLKLALADWRKGIDEATESYVKMSNDVILVSLKPENKNLQSIFQNWIDCQMPKISGSSRFVVNTSCSVKNHLSRVQEALDKLTTEIAKVDPGMRAYVDLKKELEDAVKTQAKNAGEELGKRLLGEELTAFAKSLTEAPTDEALKSAFSTVPSNKDLLVIPDAAQRAKAEMYLSNGYFDAERFAPIYNAVVLSKLALLDMAGQNDLAKKLTVVADYKAGKYTCTSREGCINYPIEYYVSTKSKDVKFDGNEHLCYTENILFSAIKSIDGDHQWREFSPPYPRASGFATNKTAKQMNYGYGASDGNAAGFCYWKPSARNAVFRSLFKGALVKGLESVDSLNQETGNQFAKVLPTNYPYALYDQSPDFVTRPIETWAPSGCRYVTGQERICTSGQYGSSCTIQSTFSKDYCAP